MVEQVIGQTKELSVDNAKNTSNATTTGHTNTVRVKPEHDPTVRNAQVKHPACAGCKRLKVKCVRQDPSDPLSPCFRCIKKKIECVLGKSVKRHPDDYNAVDQSDFQRKRQEISPLQQQHTGIEASGKSKAGAGTNRRPLDSLTMREQLMSSWKLLTGRDDLRIRLLRENELASFAKPGNDVVTRRLFTLDQVMHRIALYRTEIYPQFPIVPCPPGDDFEVLLNQSPVLIHTILDISSLLIRDKSQIEASFILHNTVLRTVIDEIMLVSVKNFELLQCLTLLTHWYNESELYHQQRLHALTALAVSVSHDLGLGGSVVPNSGLTRVPAFEQMVAPQTAYESRSPESYRIWLAVYTTLFQSLIANRRPVMSMFNEYTQDAINATRAKYGPTADPAVLQIWDLATLRHLQESIIMELYKNNNEPLAPDLNNPTVQYLVQHFDTEIDILERNTHSSDRCHVVLLMCRMLLHQAILYSTFDESLGRAPFTNFSLNLNCGELSFQTARSFTICYKSTVEALTSVMKREKRTLAAETSSFWTALTLSCDILLKCRACCIFNKNYAAVCFVSDNDLNYITDTVALCDELIEEYPNCNNAVSFGFFIKLLLCHHDARFHFYSSRIPMSALGDPRFVITRAGDSDINGQELIRPNLDESHLSISNGGSACSSAGATPLSMTSRATLLPGESFGGESSSLDTTAVSFVNEDPPIFDGPAITRVNSISPSQVSPRQQVYPLQQQQLFTPSLSPTSEKHDLDYAYAPTDPIQDPLEVPRNQMESQVLDSALWNDIENFWKDFLSQSGTYPFT